MSHLSIALFFYKPSVEQIYFESIQGVPKRSLNHAVHTDTQLENEEVEQLKLQLDQQKDEFIAQIEQLVTLRAPPLR